MHRYIIRRLLLMIPVMIGVSFLVFFILDLAPGDIVDVIAPEDATIEDKERMREEMGLNRNVVVRYIDYMSDLVRGDLGTSHLTGRDVFKTFMEKVPNTLYLGTLSIVFSVALSLPLGIFAAKRRGTVADNISMVLALIGLSMPNFWLGLLLIIVFSLKLGWLPSGGTEGITSVILPMVTIGTGQMAILTRTTRSSMLEVIRQDYLRTARAKGVTEKRVINHHALRNALIPIVTIIGTQVSTVLGGAVLTETVFSWPGIGRLIIDSLNSRDTIQVTGSLIMTTMFISVIMLMVDLLYGVIDPRIKAQYSSKKGDDSSGKSKTSTSGASK
ncbi:ABC transporter permease [Tyzzerella sp. OttesenSCG-928-J15]|nr:ABC transporter permease [Tyzzerella sp. OttesenSCG-928-J15]